MATKVDIDVSKRVVTRRNLTTGEVSYSDLAGRPISAPTPTPTTSSSYTPAYYTPARPEELAKIDQARTTMPVVTNQEQQFTRASPEAIRSATTIRSRSPPPSQNIEPNFNLITPDGVVPAQVTYTEVGFSPASPQALREIDIKAGRGISGGTGRIDETSFSGTSSTSQALRSAAFQIGVKQEQIVRESPKRGFIQQTELIGFGVARRVAQTGAVALDYFNPVQTPTQRMKARQQIADSLRPAGYAIEAGTTRAYREGGAAGVAFAGVGAVSTLAVAPLTMAKDRPGEFLFDVGAISIAGSVAGRSIAGTPSGVPMGNVRVSARPNIQTRTGFAAETIQQTIPATKQPTIRYSFAESRGVLRTPAQTVLDVAPTGALKRVKQIGDITQVTLQQPGATKATQITYKGTRGVRGRKVSRETIDADIQFNGDLRVFQDAVTLQAPRQAQIVSETIGIQQAQTTTTSFLKGQRVKGTVRGFATATEKTTLSPIRTTDVLTNIVKAPGKPAQLGIEVGKTTLRPQTVKYVDYLTKPRPPRLQTKTGEISLFISETPKGQVTLSQIPSKAIQTPPPFQTTRTKLVIEGELRKVGLLEQIRDALPKWRVSPKGQKKPGIQPPKKPKTIFPQETKGGVLPQPQTKSVIPTPDGARTTGTQTPPATQTRTTTQAYIDIVEGVVMKKDLTTGEVSYSDLTGRPISPPTKGILRATATATTTLSPIRTTDVLTNIVKASGKPAQVGIEVGQTTLQPQTKSVIPTPDGARTTGTQTRIGTQTRTTTQTRTAKKVSVVEIPKLKTVQQPKIQIQNPYKIKTALRTTPRVGVFSLTGNKLTTAQRQETAILSQIKPIQAIKIQQATKIIPEQKITPITKTQQITQIAPFQPITPITGGGLKIPGLIVPDIIITPPPIKPPGGGYLGTMRTRGRRVKPRRTKSVLQQFLPGAKGVKGQELTGLFLRS